MNSFPIKKNPGPGDFTSEIYQKFEEELTPIILKLPKSKSGKHLLSHSRTPKPGEDTTKQESQRLIFFMYIKILNNY